MHTIHIHHVSQAGLEACFRSSTTYQQELAAAQEMLEEDYQIVRHVSAQTCIWLGFGSEYRDFASLWYSKRTGEPN